MKLNKKQAAAVIAASTVAVTGVGVAFAAWTATGSGSGNAKAASAKTATVSVIASPTADDALWPGNPDAVAVNFNVDNTNPYDVTYTTFSHAVIDSVSGTCSSSLFSLTNTSGSLAANVPVTAGDSAAGATAPILKMGAAATDVCQGAVVTIKLDVAGSQD